MNFLSNLFGGGAKSGLNLDLGDVRQQAAAEQAQQQPFVFEAYTPARQGLFNGPRGVLGGIGRIGDALAMAGGKAPLYRQYVQEEDTRSALGALAEDPNNQNALAQLARSSPETLLQYRNVFARQSAQPHYWETNDGSLGAIGPDGQPRIVYKDPTPKLNWITADNGDGTKTFVPVGPNGPVGGQQPQRPAQPQQQQAPGSTIDAFGAKAMRESLGERGYEAWKQRHGITETGGTSPARATNSQTIGGKTYYQVNGKWYDNPEGR